MLLLGEHLVDVVSAEARVLNDDLGEHILGLAERQTQGRLQQPITTRRVQIDIHLLDGAHILQNSIQQRAQVFLGGQRETQDGNFLVQFRGNLQQRRHQDDRLETVLQVQRDVLELTDDGEIGLRQERMKILEEENRRFHLLQHLIQGGQRVFGGTRAPLLTLDVRARRYDARGVRPLEGLLAPAGGDVHHHGDHAQLFAGLDVNQRIPSSDEHLEFRGKRVGGHGEVDSVEGEASPESSAV